ncbi:MAG: dephospho-CoA kinase [Armatimonadetes bacterium]|nr:dephospho-CoA kinase [Armatimonadota bacterium]
MILGITGGIGTGKSTVLKMFAELGARTLSADNVARRVVEKGSPAYSEIIERFGESVLTPEGDIDRAALGRIVFSDADARRDLEEITHPRIIGSVAEEIDRFRAEPGPEKRVFAVEIPLLIECGLEDMVDEVLLVAAEQQTQVDRLTSRAQMSRDEALRRIRSQMPLDEKIEHADRVIWNDGTLEALRQSVRSIWEEILLL